MARDKTGEPHDSLNLRNILTADGSYLKRGSPYRMGLPAVDAYKKSAETIQWMVGWRNAIDG